MNKQEKNEMIAILDGMLKENNNFYLADISGLTAEENSALRRLCFKRDVSLQVVKNTLLKKAFEKNDADFSELYDVLVGNTSIMQAEAGNSPAKIIKEFRKKNEKPILKAAHVEESLYIGDENLSALADLKSKDELIGDIITLLQSPAKNVISALKSGGNQLSGIVKTLQEKTGEVPAVEEKVIQETPEVEEISAESQAEENPVAEVAEEELEKEEVIEENPVAEETSDEPKSEEKDEENSSEEESKE
jgi:large subunit ribosomal protein L10